MYISICVCVCVRIKSCPASIVCYECSVHMYSEWAITSVLEESCPKRVAIWLQNPRAAVVSQRNGKILHITQKILLHLVMVYLRSISIVERYFFT